MAAALILVASAGCTKPAPKTYTVTLSQMAFGAWRKGTHSSATSAAEASCKALSS